MRVAYTIFYHTGLRINEVRMLTRSDINDVIKSGQFNVIHFKTNQASYSCYLFYSYSRFKETKLRLPNNF